MSKSLFKLLSLSQCPSAINIYTADIPKADFLQIFLKKNNKHGFAW